MAGAIHTSGRGSDDPIPVNVTALIDIIFCLCIFFMCSFHFRQLEGKMDSWLPDHGGPGLADRARGVELEDIRVFLDAGPSGSVTRRVGAVQVPTDGELRGALRFLAAGSGRAGLGDPRVVVDADPGVAWMEVVNVLSVCRGENLTRLEFSAPRRKD
jgi:biopolymer transport protein ExbD